MNIWIFEYSAVNRIYGLSDFASSFDVIVRISLQRVEVHELDDEAGSIWSTIELD